MTEFRLPLCAIVALLLCGQTATADDDEPVSFSQQIRPLLSDRCFRCHGPDRLTREADLRFDDRESVYGDRDGHAVVVPGDVTASELARRISSDDDVERMPPADSGLSLSDAEIALIRRWIDQGAEWEKHWAYIAPERPDVPVVETSDWVRNPIDAFVLSRLEREGLSPSAGAGPRTLIRRVSFDLTGLPPSPAEIDRFLSDEGPRAYEQLVERLLDSERFGEKMALPWLEAARYADTSGYQEDYGRTMHPWRTWVIEAFNDDMPFDRFVIEQMAGDLLDEATHEQVLATAFHRNHRINQEVGAIPDEFIVEYAIDRLETVGTVFLGTTIGCARCHDHKYDPFSQQEFYGLYAFLNNCADEGLDQQSRFGFCKPFVDHPTPAEQVELARLQQAHDDLKAEESPSPEELAAYDDWLKEWDCPQTLGISDWHSIGPFEHAEATRVTGFETPLIGEPQVDLEQTFGEQTWTQRPNWPSTGPPFLGGEFNTYYLLRELDAQDAGQITISLGASDAFKVWVNGELIFSRVETGENQAKGAPMQVPLKAGRNELLFKLSNGGFEQTFVFEPVGVQTVPAKAFAVISVPSPERSAEQRQQLYEFFHQQRLAAAQQAIDDLRKTFAKVMVMQEREEIRPAHVLGRGSYDQPQEEIGRGVPAVLPSLPEGAPVNRLGLAQWLVAPDHPLTARVTVNRFWQACFGTGIVKTTEDFGAQGEFPSHPQLLDWLAVEFIDSGWDVKHLMKLIVTSSTYRQSSRSSAELNERDPGNRLLARGPRLRLRAQEIRDQALFVSGLLVERIGGPSVRPHQPPGLWAEVSNLLLQEQWALTNRFVPSEGDDLHRRSLYTYWKRAVPPPNMTVFDAEAREVCSVRPQVSNTPLQALNLLNDATYVEAARHLARRMLTEGGATDAERLAYGMELVTSRLPAAAEMSILQRGLARHRAVYQQDFQAAAALLARGESQSSRDVKITDHAAYAQVALLLLNLDETITKQ